MFTLQELIEAHALVSAHVPPTPQYAWPLLAQRAGATVWIKHENHTPTGAFKVRGGLTYLDGLRRQGGDIPGLITATRGNHGQSLAFAARRHGASITIVVPHGNSVEKNAAMRALGADLVEHGDDFQAAREEAERRARSQGLHMVPSFHRDLVLGVATYALELLRAVPDLDVLYVPIGLGSGICGCILARDLLGLSTQIVGVQAQGAPSYALSLREGRPTATATAQTFADGLATRVPVPEAFEIIQRGASHIVEVSDEEILAAVKAFWTDTHNLAEGAGAAGLAGLLKESAERQGANAGVVLCGGNIDLAAFHTLMATADAV